MTSAQEIRAEGWQADYGKLTTTVALLAADLLRHRRQDTALRALVLQWRERADECCMVQVAGELRMCAGEVDGVLGGTVRTHAKCSATMTRCRPTSSPAIHPRISSAPAGIPASGDAPAADASRALSAAISRSALAVPAASCRLSMIPATRSSASSSLALRHVSTWACSEAVSGTSR